MRKERQKSGGINKKYIILAFLAVSILIYLYFAVQTKDLHYFDDLGSKNNLSSETIQNLKDSYKTPEGDVFLDSVDSYYSYSRAMMIEKGSIKNPELLPFLEFGFYKTLQTFDKNITLIGSIFYLPLIFGALSIVLVFFIAKKIMNIYAGFFASLLFALNIAVMNIFRAGMGDTNPLNILLSLLFVFLFLNLFESLKKKEKSRTIFYLAAAIITVAIFSFAWDGWYYILFVTAVFLWLYGIIYLVKKGKRSSAFLTFVVPVILAAVIFLAKVMPKEILYYLTKPGTIGKYPAYFSNIKELATPTLESFLRASGGWIFLAVGIFAFAVILLQTKLFTKEKSENMLYLSAWLVVMAVVFLIVSRFASFFATPFCIMSGIGIALILGFIWKISFIEKKKLGMVVLALFAVLMVVFMSQGIIKVTKDLPDMEKSVYYNAEKIKQVSSENALIFVFWDEGHLYNAFAERDVYQKGGPNAEKTYKFAKILTASENESLGLLKEEGCDKRECFIVLSSLMKDYASYLFRMANWDVETKSYKSTPKMFVSFDPCIVDTQNGIASCGKSFLDIKNKTAYYNGSKISVIFPHNASSFVYTNENTPLTLIVYQEENAASSVVLRTEALSSLMVRMYFMNGYGLKYFKRAGDYSTQFKRSISYKLVTGTENQAGQLPQ